VLLASERQADALVWAAVLQPVHAAAVRRGEQQRAVLVWLVCHKFRQAAGALLDVLPT
jgi:hypothetical protein